MLEPSLVQEEMIHLQRHFRVSLSRTPNLTSREHEKPDLDLLVSL